MNNDHRNIALVGTTDGVPFFSDQIRGGWPFVLRCANLPDSLSTHMANCHLHLLSANEFWEVDKDAGILRRRVRAPKSLNPHMHLVVDDLLGAYNVGVRVTDATIPKGHDGHQFNCRVCLLFWTGDYPAQAAVSGTHSKTCHWCHHKSQSAPEISRRTWGEYRRFLPDEHPMRRRSGFFGPTEQRPPPVTRTHDSFVNDGKRNVEHGQKLLLPNARREGKYRKI